MKMLDKISNTLYQVKTDKIIRYTSVFNLQEECSKFDMFVNAKDLYEETEIEDRGIQCFYDEGQRIGNIISKKTYYFFNGNTCITYYKSGYDRIIKVLVKSPEDKWTIDKEMKDDGFYHIQVTNNYVEVYAWWDVDWMSCGKRDINSYMKEGSWWKSVYDDITKMYEEVAKKHVDYVFDTIYSAYEKKER